MNVIEFPDEWPEWFPLPEGSQPLAVEDEGGTLRLRFTAPAGVDLPAFFSEALPANGWDAELSGPEGELSIEIAGHGFFGQIERDPSAPGSFWVQIVG